MSMAPLYNLIRCHIIKRTMRLHMMECHPGSLTEALQGTDLIDHIGPNLIRRLHHDSATKSDDVRKRGVSTDRHTKVGQATDRALHRSRIATVKSTGNIGAGDKREEIVIRADLEGPETFANIAVDINGESRRHDLLLIPGPCRLKPFPCIVQNLAPSMVE